MFLFTQVIVYVAKEFVGGVYECTDLVISGHTLTFTSMSMLWLLYNTKPRVLSYLMLGVALWCLVLINLSFFHYTIDIVMGVFFAVGTWTIYHLLLDIALLRVYREVTEKPGSPVRVPKRSVGDSFSKRFGLLADSLIRFIVWIEALNIRLTYALQHCDETAEKSPDSHTPSVVASSKISELHHIEAMLFHTMAGQGKVDFSFCRSFLSSRMARGLAMNFRRPKRMDT